MHSLPWRTFVLAAVLLPRLSAAWDNSFNASGSLPSDFVPTKMTAPDANGFWASGTANGGPALVRYGKDGSVQLVHYPYLASFDGGYYGASQTFALTAYPDGGVLGVEYLNGYSIDNCYVHRHDSSGRLLWSLQGGSNGFGYNTPCVTSIGIEGGGNIRLLGGNRFAADGSSLPRVPGSQDDLIGESTVADTFTSATYVVGSVGLFDLTLLPFHATATVEKIGIDGKVLWRAQAPGADNETVLYSAFVGNDGNLYAYGLQGTSDGKNLKLYGMSLAADGSVRWSHNFPVIGSALSDNIDSAILSDGSAAVAYYHQTGNGSLDSSATLAKISASGALLWQKSSGLPAVGTNLYYDSSSLRIAGNDDMTVAVQCVINQSGGPSEWPVVQSRFDVGGNALYTGKTVAPGSATRFDLATLPDNSSVTRANGAFLRLDRNGNALAPQRTTGVIADASDDVAEAIAGDGSVYVLTTNSSTLSYAVTAYEKDGSKRWSTVLGAKTASGAMASAGLITRNADVCAVGILDAAQVVQCYARDTGTPTPQVQLAASIPDLTQKSDSTALTNGQLLVLYNAADGSMHHALLDAQVRLLHDISLLAAGETWGATSVNASGSAAIQTSANALVKFKSDGTRAFSVSPDMASYQVRLAEDDSTLLVQAAPTPVVERLDASGKPLWKSVLPLPLGNGGQPPRIRAPSIRFSASDVYLYLYDGASYITGTSFNVGYVVKLALDTGNMHWSVAAPYPRPTTGVPVVTPPRLLLDAASQRAALLTNYAWKIEFRYLNMSDGSEAGIRAESMAVDSFTLYDAAFAEDGSLVTVSDTSDNNTGSTWQINLLSQPFGIAPPIRTDQPGIAGTWYAPYSTGQGFVLDYIAGANTVFMPWFTFSRTQVNDPSSLAWFALQGQPAPAATSVNLGIYATASPGAFNAGKTGVAQVGTAQLNFTDCSHGTLRYQFDANTNNGASGAITLSRLTPQSSACQMADGSTQAVSAAPPTQGFDARQSGSWYDPNTSGQGVELSVTPAGNGSNGLLFGAWFTYDPSGAGDDPLNQHWFTMQGDLSTASNGKVTLPIFQVLGGTLDSIPTRNANQVGTATLTFSGCDRVQLDYQFANSSVAHAYATLSGTLQLSKLGGCATP